MGKGRSSKFYTVSVLFSGPGTLTFVFVLGHSPRGWKKTIH